jgi:hypothetical protein
MALQHLRSATADKRPDPAAMAAGQLAVNTADASPGLFFKNATGTLVKIGPVHVGTTAPNATPASGGTAGNSVGEQWLDTSGANPVFKIWDGSNWVSEAGEFVNASGDTMTGALVMDNQQQVRFRETTANGTNFIAIQAPASVAADRTLTLPDVTGTLVSTGDTGTVTSTMIADGTIVNADINASAAIAGTKISPNFGSQTVQTTGVFSHAPGTAAAPTITFTGDTITGIYSPDAGQVAVATGGTGRLFINSMGRVGIGTSTPGATLDVANNTSTNIRVTNNAGNTAFNTGILLSNGTAGDPGAYSPGIAFDVGGGGGRAAIYTRRDASLGGNFIIATDNTSGVSAERLRITSAGLVGIGTSSPAERLDVAGNIQVKSTAVSGSPYIVFNSKEGAGGVERTVGQITAGAEAIDGWGLRFFTRPNGLAIAERLRITSAGNVGIGTTSPQGKFVVSNGGANGLEFYPEGTPNTNTIVSYNRSTNLYRTLKFESSDYSFTNGTTTFANIDSSGRLLVGTSSARNNFFNSTGTALIQAEGTASGSSRGMVSIVNNSTSNDGPWLLLNKSGGASIGSNTLVSNNQTLGVLGFGGNDGSEFVTAAIIVGEVDGTPGANDMPGRLVFSVTADGSALPTEAMRINNAGELLVGYTTDNGAYKLQVNSQIFATSATIATSDGRYKENVATLDGCVDLIKALRPVSFDWKAQQDITRIDDEGNEVLVREGHNFPGGTQVGFIAQEVQEVLADKPWLGSVIKRNVRPAVTDNDGNELAPEEEFLGIAEGNLVAVLTSALKDAIGRIESLEAEVAALKA